MKKNTIKAFTLVEMLIVIVIIGILIAALMPRMQSAQGRARDVSRKNALSQIQTAIVTSQQDKGEWPGINSGADAGTGVQGIKTALETAGMTSVPKDPIETNKNFGLGTNFDTEELEGDYLYLVANRNGTTNGGFVLMAKTEVEGGSNWVYCGNGTSAAQEISGGYIKNDTDISKLTTCTKFVQSTTGSCGIDRGSSTCTYSEEGQLRYILLY